MIGQSYEDRRDMIVTHAWESWTKNGLNLDDEDRRETEKTVQDAANNSYHEYMNDAEWLAATLLWLSVFDAVDNYASVVERGRK